MARKSRPPEDVSAITSPVVASRSFAGSPRPAIHRSITKLESCMRSPGCSGSAAIDDTPGFADGALDRPRLADDDFGADAHIGLDLPGEALRGRRHVRLRHALDDHLQPIERSF